MSIGTLWWLRLLPLLAGTVAVGSDSWVVAGFLPDLAKDVAVSVSMAGASVTVFAVAYAAGAPLLAAVTSAQPPRRLIAAALVVLGLANVVCALSSALPTTVMFPAFMAGRVGAALAASVVTPTAGVLAARVATVRHRGRALALVISGLSIATALGVPAGSVVARVLTWQHVLLIVAGLSWAAAILIWLTAPNPGAGHRRTLTDQLAPLARRSVLPVLVLTSVGLGAAYVPYAYASVWSPATSGAWLTAVLAAYGVGAVVGSLGSGVLTDRVGPRRTLAIAYGLMAVAFSGIAVRPPAVAVIALAGLWGASCWAQTPPQQHRLLTLAPHLGPVLIATNASALYAGIAVGNAVGALVLDWGATAMCLTAASAALVALIWNLSLPIRHPPARNGPVEGAFAGGRDVSDADGRHGS